MGYLRCEACGAKALSAASTCPSCLHVLDLYDVGGRRVALRRCSGCDLMHRVDRPCGACGDAPAVSVRPWAVRGAVAAGIAVMLWVGASLDGGLGSDRKSIATVGGTVAGSRVVVAAGAAAGSDAPEAGQAAIVARREPADAAAPAEVGEVAAAPDSTSWQPAVARTWVNVRSDASLDGEVVGVISPESRALLGATRRGWRRVTLDEVTGWVDPRHFSSASSGG